jgi:hypothetical protein
VRAALGLQCSDHAIAQAVRRCPWKAEQLPLPDPDATSAKISTGTASSNSGGQHAVAVIDYGGFGKTERAKPRFDDDK